MIKWSRIVGCSIKHHMATNWGVQSHHGQQWIDAYVRNIYKYGNENDYYSLY